MKLTTTPGPAAPSRGRLTTHDRHIEAQRYLATFIREIKHYKTLWGMPPGKIAFREAVKAAQQERRAYDKCS